MDGPRTRRKAAEAAADTAAPTDTAAAVFPVVVITLTPVYDLGVVYRCNVFTDREAAVAGGRRMYRQQVNSMFRGGAAEASGVEDAFASQAGLSSLTVKEVRKVWRSGGEGDSPQIVAQPCPAYALIMRCVMKHGAPMEVVETLPKDLRTCTDGAPHNTTCVASAHIASATNTPHNTSHLTHH